MAPARRVGRHTIEISNPDKVLFPDDGITKGDLVDYYGAIAKTMLPHVRDRLMTLERYPDGVQGKRFFSKDAPEHFPDWIARMTVAKKGGTVTHVVCDRAATLVYLANQACITPHVGLSRVDRLEHPDHMIFDLDPSGDDFEIVRATALAARRVLDDLGLRSFVRTSGSRGLHVFVPLNRKAPFADIRAFARDVATLLAKRDPERVTVESRKEKRRGRLFLDWLRNAYGQHAVATYGVRARPGAPVAIPLDWDEVEDGELRPARFSLSEAVERSHRADPWRNWRRGAKSLARARRRLDAMLAEP